MRRREFSLAMAGMLAPAPLRAASFRADATPAMGEPLIWVDPAKEILDPLWAKGVVIEGAAGRIVLCAVDWCGIGGSIHHMFRERIAKAAGTTVDKVALQAVHQHTAPYVEGGAYALMAGLAKPPLMMSQRFLDAVTGRISEAVRDASRRMAPVDEVGLGSFNLDRVGSARRLMVDGKLATRFSSSGKDPQMAALPEGDIDTRIRTVTLSSRGKPLARIHYYASHPQTFCCNGQVTGDFVSAAREAVERKDGVPQVYFTGCAGDVTVGKYNDGGADARASLAKRMEAGMFASIQSTTLRPAGEMSWQSAKLTLPLRPGPKPEWPPAGAGSLDGQQIYRRAIVAAFARGGEPFSVSCLGLGGLRIVHLPGEPMLEFQRHAGDAIVAGYGDISPGYLCTDKAFEEGGYEPSASSAGPGTEAAVKQAISAVLGRARG